MIGQESRIIHSLTEMNLKPELPYFQNSFLLIQHPPRVRVMTRKSLIVQKERRLVTLEKAKTAALLPWYCLESTGLYYVHMQYVLAYARVCTCAHAHCTQEEQSFWDRTKPQSPSHISECQTSQQAPRFKMAEKLYAVLPSRHHKLKRGGT